MSLNHHDLKNTILDIVSIDEFEPKSGKDVDVIVVAFYLDEREPAEDLNTFIQRGFVDTLDVEVSPNTDEDGKYVVFVEFSRDEHFIEKLRALLKDVKNVGGDVNWRVRTYFSNGQTYNIDDVELLDYIIIDPKQYVPKEEFKMEKIEENLKEFFGDTMSTHLTMSRERFTISGNGKSVSADIVDIGDYDTVIGRNFLGESAFRPDRIPYEAQVLRSIIGGCDVLPIGKFLAVSKNNQVMILKNTQLEYGAL